MAGNNQGSKRDLGQVWTPRWLVENMLDQVAYTTDNPAILTMRIMEPSFGEGAFLRIIVERLIAAGFQAGKTPGQISDLIAANIWGVEYDENAYDVALALLHDDLQTAGIPRPERWPLYRQDALLFETQVKFDRVVGNPPYVRVHHMPPTVRAAIQHFTHANGTTDLYIIFFELGLSLLTDNGLLAYVTPNSFLRTTSQQPFRARMLTEYRLRHLTDFGSRQVFDNAQTYAAVTILGGVRQDADTFTYHARTGQNDYDVTLTYAAALVVPRAPWVFPDVADAAFLAEVAERPRALGDIVQAQYGIETFRNSIYTAPVGVEAALLRPVVKAATYKGTPISDHIFFPYRYVEGKPVIIPEAEIIAHYPGAYTFIKIHEVELLLRDRDRGSLWYAYGRNQGLGNMDKPKLTLSHVVSAIQTQLAPQALDATTAVYSGIFLTALPDGLPLTEIATILATEDFCRYVRLVGKDMAGGYKSFTTKNLKAYRIN